MTRANMAAAPSKEREHTVATPTVRVLWINRHVVCKDKTSSNDENNVASYNSISEVDECIVGELVNLDIVQFRPTINIIA